MTPLVRCARSMSAFRSRKWPSMNIVRAQPGVAACATAGASKQRGRSGGLASGSAGGVTAGGVGLRAQSPR